MIAIMVALQAQIMWRRAQVLLLAPAPVHTSPPEAHTHQPSLVARPPVPAGGPRLCAGAGGFRYAGGRRRKPKPSFNSLFGTDLPR